MKLFNSAHLINIINKIRQDGKKNEINHNNKINCTSLNNYQDTQKAISHKKVFCHTHYSDTNQTDLIRKHEHKISNKIINSNTRNICKIEYFVKLKYKMSTNDFSKMQGHICIITRKGMLSVAHAFIINNNTR